MYKRQLNIYEQDDVLGHVRAVAPVSYTHLVGAVELVADKGTKATFDPAQGVGAFLIKRAHHHGLILRALADIIAFCPPLIISESEIDLLLERFGLALDDTLAMARESCAFAK